MGNAPETVGTGVQHREISPEDAGQRIDNYLLRTLKGVPRSRVYRLLRKGEVRVDGRRARPTRRLEAGEVVRLPPLQGVRRELAQRGVQDGLAERLRDGILYEDDALLVIDKPAGLAVHGGSSVRIGLIEALKQLRPDDRFLELVHRIDRETSGCLMVARRRSALRALHEALREGRITKHYRALLVGRFVGVQRIDSPLERMRDTHAERPVRVSEQGKQAVSHFRAVESLGAYTRVDVQIETGRTHQIRAHARHIGHPVAGDARYGSPEANQALAAVGLQRLSLHAERLQLEHPTERGRIEIVCPPGPDLTGPEDALRGGRPSERTG